MSEQDGTASDFVNELAKAGDIRLEQHREALGGKTPGEPPAAPEADKPEPDTATPSAGNVTADADKGEDPTPPSVQTPDLSWLPENVRSQATQIPSELLAELRNGFMRHADYTRKNQVRAEEMRAIEPLRAKADLWTRLESNPEAARAAQDVLEGKNKPAERDEDVDILTLSGPELKAWIRSEADRAAMGRAEEAAKRAAEATFHERLEKPKEVLSEIASVLDGWASENGLTKDSAEAAIREAAAHSRELGLTWTPENAAKLASLGLAMTKTQEVKQVAARDDAGKFAKVASPVGRGSVTAPVRTEPIVVREGRAPKNDRERREFAAHIARERFGLNVTADELDNLFQR